MFCTDLTLSNLAGYLWRWAQCRFLLPWALDLDVDSSGFCIWKLFRSDLSGNTTWTSLWLRLQSSTGSRFQTRKESLLWIIPQKSLNTLKPSWSPMSSECLGSPRQKTHQSTLLTDGQNHALHCGLNLNLICGLTCTQAITYLLCRSPLLAMSRSVTISIDKFLSQFLSSNPKLSLLIVQEEIVTQELWLPFGSE